MDDIRAKAEALVKLMEGHVASSTSNTLADIMRVDQLMDHREFKNLKASLRPSREEIAEYLDCEIDLAIELPTEELNKHNQYLEYAIEELRK